MTSFFNVPIRIDVLLGIDSPTNKNTPNEDGLTINTAKIIKSIYELSY